MNARTRAGSPARDRRCRWLEILRYPLRGERRSRSLGNVHKPSEFSPRRVPAGHRANNISDHTPRAARTIGRPDEKHIKLDRALSGVRMPECLLNLGDVLRDIHRERCSLCRHHTNRYAQLEKAKDFDIFPCFHIAFSSEIRVLP